MKLQNLSIVIPAYNEEKHIPKLLDSLMKIDYPKEKMEIIVVDDGSRDRTPEILSKYPVKVIKGLHKGVGVARNLGCKHAKNEIIIFFDSDMIVDKNYLKKVVKYFDKHGVVVGGDTTIINNKDKIIARMLYLRNVLGRVQYNSPFVRVCPKKLFEEMGGFDPSYGYYDDWELLQRIKKKYKIHRIPKAKVYHNEPENWEELWRQCRWVGKSMIFSFKGYVKEGIRRIMFPLLCASLPLYLIFLFLPFPLWVLGGIGLFLFLTVELSRSIKMYSLTKWKESFLTPLFDFISMSLVVLGMLMGLMDKSTPKA